MARRRLCESNLGVQTAAASTGNHKTKAGSCGLREQLSAEPRLVFVLRPDPDESVLSTELGA